MRIPPHLREIATALGLRDWVKKGGCATEKHFESIELFRERLEAVGDENEVDMSLIALMLAQVLDKEGKLEEHVLDVGTYPIRDEETWKKICVAAAWVVLQAYDRERRAATGVAA